MAYSLGATLIASLVAANVLYLYDLNITGPAWARPSICSAPSTLALLVLTGGLHSGKDYEKIVVLMFAANLLALVWVAVLQLLGVQRDAAMAVVLRRR
jgi:uncharacterized PurR-regulated membrane protein YhhQ (DUF165 family)